MADSLDVWRVVFDVAISSMDFGSGFLDEEEVMALRKAAVILGVDPDTATPANFRCRHRGHHAAQVILEQPYFDGPDGIKRNAYLRAGDYPADVQGRLKRIGTLGMLRAPVLRMFCPDCGRRWDALEEPPGLGGQPDV